MYSHAKAEFRGRQTNDFIAGLKTIDIPAGELGKVGIIELLNQLKRFADNWDKESMSSAQALRGLADHLPALMGQKNAMAPYHLLNSLK
jgi:hypothetical protein